MVNGVFIRKFEYTRIMYLFVEYIRLLFEYLLACELSLNVM